MKKKEKYDFFYFHGVGSPYKSLLRYDNPLFRLSSRITFRKALSLIKKYKSNGRLLEIGCAFGYFLKLASKFFEVVGCDVSAYAVKQAKKRYPELRTLQMDIEKGIKFRSNCFDVVAVLDVLEHLRKLNFVLDEIKRVLKNKGLLLVSVQYLSYILQEKTLLMYGTLLLKNG